MKLCNFPGCKHEAWKTHNGTRVLDTCFNHTAPPEATVRAVWRAVCDDPRASLKEIGHQCGIVASTVNRAMHELTRRGWIGREPLISRSTVIKVACYHGQPYRVVWFDPS